jgi:hypothetical protein
MLQSRTTAENLNALPAQLPTYFLKKLHAAKCTYAAGFEPV